MGSDLPAAPRWAPSVGHLLTIAVAALGLVMLVLTPPSQASVHSAREVWAFLTPWDATSVDSFRHHAGQISVLVASDLALRADGTFISEMPPGVERLAHGRGVKIEPLLTNDVGGWKPRMADRV